MIPSEQTDERKRSGKETKIFLLKPLSSQNDCAVSKPELTEQQHQRLLAVVEIYFIETVPSIQKQINKQITISSFRYKVYTMDYIKQSILKTRYPTWEAYRYPQKKIQAMETSF